jgi:hypothetical protein
MKSLTIGLPVFALGVAALLSAGCDAKGEVAQAATNSALAQESIASPVPTSPTAVTRAMSPPSPSENGAATTAPDASKGTDAPQASTAPLDAGAALRTATEQKKYLFLAFYRPGDSGNDELMKTFGEAEKTLSERATFYRANMQEEKERRMVEAYQVTRAPLPLTLVFASNGAFVNAFRGKTATLSEMTASFLSPKFAEAVKALQDRKIVLLCLQGKDTQHNAESLAAAQATSQAKESNGMITLVQVAPEDNESKDLLGQLKVDAKLKEATLFVLVPPSNLAGKIEGATTKEVVWQAVVKGVSSCGPSGCGPSGCGPSAAGAKK